MRVPLPQEPLRPVSRNGFAAPGSAAPIADVAGKQAQEMGQAFTSAGLSVAQQATALEEAGFVATAKEALALAEEKIVDADLAYTTLVGRDATDGALKRAMDELDKELRNIEQGIKHATPRDLYRRAVQQRRTDLRARWGRHEAKQILVRELGAGEAALKSKQGLAQRMIPELVGAPQGAQEPPLGAGPGVGPVDGQAPGLPQEPQGGPQKPASVASYLQAVRVEAQAQADRMRLTPGEAKLFVQNALTEVHDGVVRVLADRGRGSEAGEYLAKWGDEVSTKALHKLQGVVRTASVQEEAGRLVLKTEDDLIKERAAQETERLLQEQRGGRAVGLQEFQDALEPRMRAPEMLARMRNRIRDLWRNEEISIELRDAAINEAEHKLKEQIDVEAMQIIDVRARARAHVREHGPSLTPSLFEEVKFWGLLQETQDFAAGKGYLSDPVALLQSEAISDQELRDMSLTQLRAMFEGRLSPLNLAGLGARWRKLRGEATKQDESYLNARDRLMTSLRLDPSGKLWPARGKPSEEQILDRDRMEIELQRRLQEYKMAGREVPTGEDLQEIIDKMLIERAVIPGKHWYSSDVTAPIASFRDEELAQAELQPEGQGVRMPLIPDEIRKIIEDDIRASGDPVTPEAVGRIYREVLRRERLAKLRQR